jgi:hypothetical protein
MSGTERKEFMFDDDVLLETVELTRAFNRRFGKRVPPGEDDRSADATPRASGSSN